MSLHVYQLVPAAERTAQWLRRLLQPAIEAARFEHAPPVELRTTGAWAGWASSRDMAPDGRVALSNRILFWSTRTIRDVYLHEAAHSLLHQVPGATPSHDCSFFALNVALRLRVGTHRPSDCDPVSLVAAVSLYDLSDLPVELAEDADGGLGRCVTWAIATANEMACTDLSAEGLAREIVERYQTWLAELRDQPRLDRIAVSRSSRQAQSHAAIVDGLRDKLFLATFVAGISSALLLLIFVMLVRR